MPNVANEGDFELGELFKRKGAKFDYIYDFGDGWQHKLVVESISAVEPGITYPRCLDGELACPPDDSGALYGYYRILEILENPEDEAYETYREWMPRDFDPGKFSVDKANENLGRLGVMRDLAENDVYPEEPMRTEIDGGYEE